MYALVITEGFTAKVLRLSLGTQALVPISPS